MFWSQTLKELEKLVGRVRNPMLGRLKAKDSIFDATKGGYVIFPVADGTAKLSGRDREFREPTLR